MAQTIIKTMKDLQNEKQWVCWKYEERGGKKTKVPYNPQTGGKAMSNNPDTWTTFDYAKSKIENFDGIGFMFANGISGIDIDNKTGNPELDKQAETVINLMNTHTERSPSGTGYHLIFRCDMSKIPQMTVKENGKDKTKLDGKYYVKNPYNDLECYFSGLTNRFFTYTGNSINDKNIEDRADEVLYFLENFMLKDKFQKKNTRQERTEENKSGNPTDAILKKAREAKNGVKFSALYDRGDLSYNNNNHSSADEALCTMLAFWLQGDFNEIDRYFRQSALCQTKERIEKWNRVDYRTATINKAIEQNGGNYYTPPGRPKKEKQKKEYTPEQEEILKNIQNNYGVYDDEKITIAAVAFHLEQMGVMVKYNEITRKDEFQGNISDYKNEHIKNDFPIEIYNVLNLTYNKCPKKDVFDFMKRISNKNAYNPVIELIEGGKWDGIDRLPELYCILGMNPKDTLSQTLIYKWVWQNLSMARNDKGKFGADGLLVLQGDQGIGKTTFARKMALRDEWFADGLHLNFSDKDTTRRATSVWIGELGEISRTFKSDIDALKAFITTPQDIYRLPYGHADEELSRRTSFIGTCNDKHYLIDETGNRRFWTVPIAEIDLKTLKNFNAFQLYMQVYEHAKFNIQGFRLTKEEQKLLAERNGQFEKPLKAEMEIRDILSRVKETDLLEEMTASEFKDKYPILRNYDASQIGKALNKIGVGQRNTKKGSFYMLPAPPKNNWNY